MKVFHYAADLESQKPKVKPEVQLNNDECNEPKPKAEKKEKKKKDRQTKGLQSEKV